MLILTTEQMQLLYAQAEQAYPEECCGLLLGQWEIQTGRRVVLEVCPLKNTWTPDIPETEVAVSAAGQSFDRRRRYWIDPRELLQAQRQSRDRGWVILGVYHSHPDHPAVPSECDRTLAWHEYSYPILSVQAGQVVDCQSWQLDENAQFQAETLEINKESNGV